jgi:EPS-associated MarR family transcriptional regulator
MKHIQETLRLLEHIEANPQATQRELVDKLDVSLGKVNFIINSLAQRGLIKLERFKTSTKKRAYLYILTPKGIVQKAVITKNFLEKKIEEYESLKKEIELLKARVESK